MPEEIMELTSTINTEMDIDSQVETVLSFASIFQYSLLIESILRDLLALDSAIDLEEV